MNWKGKYSDPKKGDKIRVTKLFEKEELSFKEGDILYIRETPIKHNTYGWAYTVGKTKTGSSYPEVIYAGEFEVMR